MQEEVPQPELPSVPVDQKTLLEGLGGRDIKDKPSELFTRNKHKSRITSDAQLSAVPAETKKEKGNVRCLDWGAGYMPRGRAEISEACRQAFTATCHLLLECTTFPIYLSEEESLNLYTGMFCHTGELSSNNCSLTTLSATYYITNKM